MIIFGFKERVLPKKNIRQEEEKFIKEVFNMVQEKKFRDFRRNRGDTQAKEI